MCVVAKVANAFELATTNLRIKKEREIRENTESLLSIISFVEVKTSKQKSENAN